ncbi:MAG: hypothetical protein H7X88_07225 [Gloeobacteraceae cyanobacterium ES-bin-316]|nr:hypothetical protein [Ferruginibacter sp.]
MKKILTALLLGCVFNCFAQDALPTLTKKQMYADYDTLIIALTKINPHHFIRQKVNNYAQSDSIIALRKKIDTVSSTVSFFWLVNTALNFCQDAHTSIRGKSTYSFIDSIDRLKWNTNIADTTIIQAYRNLYNETLLAYKLNLPIKYLDGKYIVLTSFKYKATEIPADAILTACDKKEINSYVGSLQGSLKNMHWDFANKRFYADNFYKSQNHATTDSIELSFVSKQKTIKVFFKLSDTVIIEKQLKFEQGYEPAVKYFSTGQILYIRMPVMQDGDFYVSKIDSLTKIHPVSKIIFDIRDNPGGSDPEWTKVITHLISKPIIRKIISCGNIENPRRDRWFDNPIPPIKPFLNSFIQRPIYQLISDEADTLMPDRNSLNFKNKIYILQNENCFSSAGSLISTCQFSDQLVNVGNSTGWFEGFGSMPWIMLLPNSKISYWTEPRIDFTNVSKPEDLFHNNVKIKILPTKQDYIARYSYKGDWYSEDFLFNNDRVFREVTKMK